MFRWTWKYILERANVFLIMTDKTRKALEGGLVPFSLIGDLSAIVKHSKGGKVHRKEEKTQPRRKRSMAFDVDLMFSARMPS
jgi:hypothetical protein